MTPADPLALLLLQMTTILVVARAASAALRRSGQPAVVGEMLGGILLGPSFFGWLLPDLQRAIFPADRLGPLQLVSNIGAQAFEARLCVPMTQWQQPFHQPGEKRAL